MNKIRQLVRHLRGDVGVGCVRHRDARGPYVMGGDHHASRRLGENNKQQGLRRHPVRPENGA